MRVVGLLALLGGSVVLMLPLLGQLLHRRLVLPDQPLIGGALLCLGIAALILSLSSAQR
jgi:hypothetical protein